MVKKFVNLSSKSAIKVFNWAEENQDENVDAKYYFDMSVSLGFLPEPYDMWEFHNKHREHVYQYWQMRDAMYEQRDRAGRFILKKYNL